MKKITVFVTTHGVLITTEYEGAKPESVSLPISPIEKPEEIISGFIKNGFVVTKRDTVKNITTLEKNER